jgi:hypothetical protein
MELERKTKNGKRLSKKTPKDSLTKVCSDCGEEKPREEFAKGRRCKECKRVYDRERYLAKKDEIDARMREYGKTDRGREVNRRASNQYRATNRERARQRTNDWYTRTKEDETKYAELLKRKQAHNAVAYALKTGKLTKGVCEVCGDPNVEAHHDDYDKKLDVRWLCIRHHGETRQT